MLRGGEQEGVTFESIHGQDTAVIRAADLDLDRFLPAAEGRAAPAPASELPAEPAVALLTGANGFLGRFLLLDLLQRVSQRCVSWSRVIPHVSWQVLHGGMAVLTQRACAVCQCHQTHSCQSVALTHFDAGTGRHSIPARLISVWSSINDLQSSLNIDIINSN